jgi:hypothetical protein
MDWWTIVVAAYAAIVATGALALEIRRWFESGPRLSIRVMPEAEMVPAIDSKNATYLLAVATNRGNLPTTITNFALLDYGSWRGHLRRKHTWAGIPWRQEKCGEDWLCMTTCSRHESPADGFM